MARTNKDGGTTRPFKDGCAWVRVCVCVCPIQIIVLYCIAFYLLYDAAIDASSDSRHMRVVQRQWAAKACALYACLRDMFEANSHIVKGTISYSNATLMLPALVHLSPAVVFLACYLYYYRSAVHKNLSSKFDRFLAMRSQFDTVHGVDFYAPTFCLSATFVRPLFAFVLCFLRQKILNNFAFCHRCDF